MKANRSKAATHPLRRLLFFFLDATYYPRERRGSKMVGTRGQESQRDIGKLDLGAPSDIDHHSRRCNGRRGWVSTERKRGDTGYLKSVRNRRDIGIDESDVVSMGILPYTSNERKFPEARAPGFSHRTSPQKMFDQVSGCGTSIRRFNFSGSCGTSWTATFAAGSVELSLRMMCSSPSPGSTNVSPA